MNNTEKLTSKQVARLTNEQAESLKEKMLNIGETQGKRGGALQGVMSLLMATIFPHFTWLMAVTVLVAVYMPFAIKTKKDSPYERYGQQVAAVNLVAMTILNTVVFLLGAEVTLWMLENISG